jgi:protein-L-isoaspartate(D-aspartate) O-methyltransferase
MEIPLKVDGVDTGEAMWSPKMEARVLQELAIRRHEDALEIGTGSGYFAALLACKARQVVSIEIDPHLGAFCAANLARAGVHNVKQETGDASRGWSSRAPYDVIVATGSLPVVPAQLRNQLKIGGRLAAVIGNEPVMTAVIITRISDTGFDTLKLFETRIKPLRNAERPSSFRF